MSLCLSEDENKAESSSEQGLHHKGTAQLYHYWLCTPLFISKLCALSSPLNQGSGASSHLKKTNELTGLRNDPEVFWISKKGMFGGGAHMSFHYKMDYLLWRQTPRQSWIMTSESLKPFPRPTPTPAPAETKKNISRAIKAGAKCTTGNSWCRTWSRFPWREQLRTG